MNVRVDLNTPINDGMEVVFKAPCDASEVTGLNVYYPVDGVLESQVFTFADANTNDLGHFDALFAKDAVVKVILDLDTNMAFVQNADTNAYLESRLADLEAKIGTGGGSGGSYELPIATPETLGGVKPTLKTEEMTQSVGVDETGGLWTTPSEGGGSGGAVEQAELIVDITTTEEVANIQISKDLNGKAFSIKDAEFLVNIPVASARDTVVFNFAFSTVGGASVGVSMAPSTAITSYGRLFAPVATPKEEKTPTMFFASNTTGYMGTASFASSYVDKFYVTPVTSGNVLPVGTRVRLWGVRK